MDKKEVRTVKIETRRLDLLALAPRQLELLAIDLPSLEKELHCSYQAEPMKVLLKKTAEGQRRQMEQDLPHYLWYTFWLMQRKTDQVIVGSVTFRETPNASGEVEVGYGLGKAFEGQGYMTEAVKALCQWALGQKGVRHILAETEREGIRSQRILQRCGFKAQAWDDTIWWKL